MVEETLVAEFEKFFAQESVRQKLEDAASEYPKRRSFELDFSEFSKFDYELADKAFERPDAFTSAAEEAVSRLNLSSPFEVHFHPRVRFCSVPDSPGLRPMVMDLGTQHLDKLVSVEGVISSISEIKPRMKIALWKCANPDCGHTTKTATDKTLPIVPPLQCESCRKGALKLLEQSSEFVDMQRASLQDPVERLRGNIPAVHVDLWMEDDLVNQVAPGDKVVITGVLRLKPIIQGKGRSSVYAKFLDVFHIREMEIEFEELEITREEEEEIKKLASDPKLYEKIVASIAPSIYGYNELKQAIALQLFGGTPNKIMPDGERMRSDVHILMVGDPGTGKSTVLEYVSNLAPKAVVVSGGSASGVGLTASAERDELTEGWVLKAGAMVLANGGIICLDEADKMDEEDRGAMHQAMEQQKINVAKAGIVTEFQTKCSVLAAANPKLGRFDPNAPIAPQFALSPALLSRFDLIFPMRDTLDETKDKKMAEHILKGHILASTLARTGKIVEAENSGQSIVPVIDPELLRKYIAFARKTVAPQMTAQAGDAIRDYYVHLRRIGMEQNTYPVTARQIEGLIRLAEAGAKMRLNHAVEASDAQRAIDLSDFVLREVFVDKETGKLDSDVIALGQPKSKLDKIRSVIGIINSMQKEVDMVAIDDVIKESSNYGIDETYARRLVVELIKQGDLYEYKPGYIKTARKTEW